MNYLWQKGHRKIGFVTDDLFGQVGQKRYQGYQADNLNSDVLPELVFLSSKQSRLLKGIGKIFSDSFHC